MTQPGDDEWLSTSEAGALLGFHRTTMLRKLSDPAQREKWQLVEGVDWRVKPLTDPPIYQMSAAAVRRLIDRTEVIRIRRRASRAADSKLLRDRDQG